MLPVKRVCLIVLAQALLASGAWAAEPRAHADTIARLSPERFLSAPAAVRKVLSSRGCLIPQDTGHTGLRNLIHSDFGGPRTVAWAALCSRHGMTTLLVHDGIEDFSGCCSIIYFWDGRRWRELAGSD